MVATLSGETLSPLTLALVVDELLGELHKTGYYALGYADDTAILINRKFPSSVRGITNCPWTDTVVVLQDKLVHQHKQKGSNTFYQQYTVVKYLGLMFDKGLTWAAQLDKVTNRVYRAFWACVGPFGKTWGLKMKALY
jgi:hypothetical protein